MQFWKEVFFKLSGPKGRANCGVNHECTQLFYSTIFWIFSPLCVLPVSTSPMKNSAVTDTKHSDHKPVVNGITIKNNPVKNDINAI